MKPIVIIAAVVIATLRPVLPNEHVQSTYEAFAHLLVGALFGIWYVSREKWALRTVLILSAVEIVCATIGVLA